MMKSPRAFLLSCAACCVALVSTPAADSAQPFLGRWALTIPGGGAGWLGVEEAGGGLKSSILWGGGSVVPVTSTAVEDGKLVLKRVQSVQRKDAQGRNYKTNLTETITATVADDAMSLSLTRPDGKSGGDFKGKRIPPLPPAPDLTKVKFGEPVKLFNGTDLSGWKVMGSSPSGWRAENGILINDAPQEPGKHKSYANIRTEKEFEDFNLTLEFRVPLNGNSGVYLRGIYEVQVADSYGKGKDSHNCGGLYSRITPSENASKPAGEWQTYSLTLVDRHLTVVHNGKTIINNQPVLGCTGGALWSDEFRPGPLYLQGDHTSVEYRNIVIRPVVK